MMPPRCALCDRRFDPGEGGDLVDFARRPSDEAWYRRAETPGFTGHPPNVAWFCAEHLEAAKALSHLERPEAMKRLRE